MPYYSWVLQILLYIYLPATCLYHYFQEENRLAHNSKYLNNLNCYLYGLTDYRSPNLIGSIKHVIVRARGGFCVSDHQHFNIIYFDLGTAGGTYMSQNILGISKVNQIRYENLNPEL